MSQDIDPTSKYQLRLGSAVTNYSGSSTPLELYTTAIAAPGYVFDSGDGVFEVILREDGTLFREIGRITTGLEEPPPTVSYNIALGQELDIDVSSSSALVTLPANPSLQGTVTILDSQGNAAIKNITILRNGKLIDGLAENLIMDVNNACLKLVYVGGAKGWQVIRFQ